MPGEEINLVPVESTAVEVAPAEVANPIDLEAVEIASMIDADKIDLDILQIMDVLEDSLPHCLSTRCLREHSEDSPEKLAAVISELDKANHHQLLNQVSRKVRRGAYGKVNRQQSAIIAGAIIARAIAAPVESVAACYAAVPAGSFTEE